MNTILTILFVLSSIGLPAIGAWFLWVFYFLFNLFPWQAQIEYLRKENTELTNKLNKAESELNKIRERLIESLPIRKN